jgi:hypothetical protein
MPGIAATGSPRPATRSRGAPRCGSTPAAGRPGLAICSSGRAGRSGTTTATPPPSSTPTTSPPAATATEPSHYPNDRIHQPRHPADRPRAPAAVAESFASAITGAVSWRWALDVSRTRVRNQRRKSRPCHTFCDGSLHGTPTRHLASPPPTSNPSSKSTPWSAGCYRVFHRYPSYRSGPHQPYSRVTDFSYATAVRSGLPGERRL